MAKKIKTQEKSEDHMTKAVRSSAQQIWQAGLGTFTDLQQRTRAMAGDRAGHVRETVNTLEQVFEERVTRALESIGVPMRKEIDGRTDPPGRKAVRCKEAGREAGREGDRETRRQESRQKARREESCVP